MVRVEPWMQDQLSKYDKELRIVWNPTYQRFQVIRIGKTQVHDILLLQDGAGNFVRPHPNLIIYGDKELGITGIYEMDTWRWRNKVGGWTMMMENKEKTREKKRSDDMKEIRRDIAKDWYQKF